MWMFPAALLLLPTLFQAAGNPEQWVAASCASVRLVHVVPIFSCYIGEEKQGLKIILNSVIQKGYFLPIKEQ